MSQGTQSANERTPLLAGSETASAATPASLESTLVEADSIQDDRLDVNGEADDAPAKPHVSLIAVVSAEVFYQQIIHSSPDYWTDEALVRLLDLRSDFADTEAISLSRRSKVGIRLCPDSECRWRIILWSTRSHDAFARFAVPWHRPAR